MFLRVVLLFLGIFAASCLDPSSAADPFSHRTPSHFVLSILLSDQARPEMRPAGACEVPVRGESFFTLGRPEANLSMTLSMGGLLEQVAKTPADGVGVIADQPAGVHQLDLVTADGLLQGRLPVELKVRRTLVYGAIAPDAEDLNGDGDQNEWVLRVEVLPDTDGDRISDTGERTRWIFGPNQGVGFLHLGVGVTEKVSLDENLTVTSLGEFADLDGDFIPDGEDPDLDGDGVPNELEGPALACPGFSHAQLTIPGSGHAGFQCNSCHLSDNPVPLNCAACHTPEGSAWCRTPANAPVDHFKVGCEYCHVADQPWATVPGPGGAKHTNYALTGWHLRTPCFACHITGNLTQVPTDCASCHAKDAPEVHDKKNCEACHNTTSWATVRAIRNPVKRCPANVRQAQMPWGRPLVGGNPGVRGKPIP